MSLSIFRSFPHLIHSFRFCIKYFKLTKAIFLPVLVHRRVELQSLKGEIVLEKYATGIIKIGFRGSEIASKRDNTVLNFKDNARIYFSGNAVIGSGSRLSINGTCCFGDNFMDATKHHFRTVRTVNAMYRMMLHCTCSRASQRACDKN